MSILSNIKICLILLIAASISCVIHDNAYSQKMDYDGTFNKFFFDRSFSTQSNALGRIQATNPDPFTAIFSNASLLSFSDGASINYSYSSPTHPQFDNHFHFLGVEGQLSDRIHLGFTHAFIQAKVEDDSQFAGSGKIQINVLSAAYRISEHFSAGLSLNYFNYDPLVGGINPENYDGNFDTFFADLSVSWQQAYQNPIADQSKILLTTRIQNISQQELEIDFSLPFSTPKHTEIPNALTTGFKYDLSWDTNNSLFPNIGFGLLGEYQNVLNYEYRSRYSGGVKISLGDWLRLYSGYYSVSFGRTEFIDGENVASKYWNNQFTWGMGLRVPVNELSDNQYPLVLTMDYTNLPQDTFHPSANYDNFNSISVSLQFFY